MSATRRLTAIPAHRFGQPLHCLLHIDPKSPAPSVRSIGPKGIVLYIGHISPPQAVKILERASASRFDLLPAESLTTSPDQSHQFILFRELRDYLAGSGGISVITAVFEIAGALLLQGGDTACLTITGVVTLSLRRRSFSNSLMRTRNLTFQRRTATMDPRAL